jgi:hypothetical protein
MQVHHEGEGAEQLTPNAAGQAPFDTNAKLEQALGHTAPVDFTEELKQATREQATKASDWRDKPKDNYSDEEPMMGGTLNATTSEAEEAKRVEERSHRNYTLLSHESPASARPFSSANGANNDEPENVDPFANDDVPMVSQAEHHPDGLPLSKGKNIQPVTMQPIKSSTAFPVEPTASPAPYSPFPTQPSPLSDSGLSYEEAPLPDEPAVAPAPEPAPAQSQAFGLPSTPAPQPQQNQTLADLEAEVHAAASASPITNSIDDARSAVTNAFDTQPLSVGGQTTAAPEMVPIPTSPFSAPPPPPLPDFSTLPPLPPAPGEAPSAPHPGAISQQPPTAPAPAPTPGQFQIPGQ